MALQECDSPVVAIGGLPSIILDICMQRGICHHRLLAGTRLFFDDFLDECRRITPEQLFNLIQNGCTLLPPEELACLTGQRLFSACPRHIGLALLAANKPSELLIFLQRFQKLFSPLMTPVSFSDSRSIFIRWQDRFGAGRSAHFLQVVYHVALAHFIKQRTGTRQLGRYYFQSAMPNNIEHYWLALGDDLAFTQPCNVVCIPLSLWRQEWPAARAGAFDSALAALEEASYGLDDQGSFLEAFVQALLGVLERSPQLNTVAEVMAMSGATLKRKLKKHGTHFQYELDQSRFLYAFELFCRQQLTCDQVAERLRFHDSGSFRRSLKRYTGMTPQTLTSFTSHFI